MTPRSPKSPARKKARVWKAWATLTKRGALGGVAQDTPLAVFKTREDADNRCLDGWQDVGEIVRIEIREILPAPVPPRSRKSKGWGK